MRPTEQTREVAERSSSALGLSRPAQPTHRDVVSVSSGNRPEPTTGDRSSRNAAMDFTKGALVLIMVLYHWLNYFYGFEGDIYKYLRFLTPSFIFITGFLVSHIYLSKYGVSDPRPPRRLAQRGLKLLSVFLALNVVRALVLPAATRAQLISDHMSARYLFNVYVMGNVVSAGQGKAVAFYILVPIGYLLLLSAMLLIAARHFKYVFHVVGVLFLVGVFALNAAGYPSANLELLVIGLIAVILGYASIDKVNAFVRHPYLLALAYLGYLGAIQIWNVIYPVQIAGVLLTIMVIYLIGDWNEQPGSAYGIVVLLGKYSLLGYIAQIAILQVLHQAAGHVNLGRGVTLAGSFVAAAVLTILAVQLTDYAKGKSAAVDRLYKAVFA